MKILEVYVPEVDETEETAAAKLCCLCACGLASGNGGGSE